MSDNDLASLREFGLTSLQARVYVALLELGVVRASQIGPQVGVVRPEAYRILQELSTKGLVQRNLGPPATYAAVAPKRAVYILTKRFRDRLTSLSKKQVELVRSLSSVTAKADSPIERFGLITGGENTLARALRMIRRAKLEYSAIVSKYGLSRILDNGVAGTILYAKRRKVRIRLISEVNPTNAKSANYLSRHFELRTSRDLLFYMDIVDCREMIFGPAFPLRDEELSHRESDLWTNSQEFVRGMYALFERVWDESPRYNPSGIKKATIVARR